MYIDAEAGKLFELGMVRVMYKRFGDDRHSHRLPLSSNVASARRLRGAPKSGSLTEYGTGVKLPRRA
jgi:hypothetical protein